MIRSQPQSVYLRWWCPTSNTEGNVYPGEHQGIVSRDLWGAAHTIPTESPRTRANRNRAQSAALLRGPIFGTDGRAMSPNHTRRRGQFYRYYVSQAALKGTDDQTVATVRTVSAAEIETAMVDQVRALLRQAACRNTADCPRSCGGELRGRGGRTVSRTWPLSPSPAPIRRCACMSASSYAVPRSSAQRAAASPAFNDHARPDVRECFWRLLKHALISGSSPTQLREIDRISPIGLALFARPTGISEGATTTQLLRRCELSLNAVTARSGFIAEPQLVTIACQICNQPLHDNRRIRNLTIVAHFIPFARAWRAPPLSSPCVHPAQCT